MTQLMKLIEGLEHWINQTEESIGSGDDFATINNLVPILEKSGIFAADEPVIRDTRVGFASQVTLIFQLYERHLFQQNMSAAVDLLKVYDQLMQGRSKEKKLINEIEACMELESVQLIDLLNDDTVAYVMEHVNFTDDCDTIATQDELISCAYQITECNFFLTVKYHQFLQLINKTALLENAKSKIHFLIDKYITMVFNVIYLNTGVSPDSIDHHKECLSTAEKWIVEFLLPLKTLLEGIALNVSDPITITEFNQVIQHLYNGFDPGKSKYFNTNSELDVFITCSWLLQYVDRYTAGTCSERDLGCPNILEHAKKLDRAGKSLDQITRAFSSLKLPMTLMSDYMQSVLVPKMVTSLELYLNHSMTKLNLAQVSVIYVVR